MLSSRLQPIIQSTLRPVRASSSRIPLRNSSCNRYLLIHDFFTRHAASFTTSTTSPTRRRNVSLSVRFQSSPQGRSIRFQTTDSQHKVPCPDCPHVESPRRGHAQEYTPFIQRLIRRTHSLKPNSPHRPTREELLSAASTRWERFRVRLMWFFIRGWRRFNADDLSAFASWFVLGNTLWILIGTTTFVSVVLLTLNSLSLQNHVARWISDYLTSETGVNVV